MSKADNPIHIAFLLMLLLVFGAKRLPEMGRSLGEGMRGFKDSISGDTTHTLSAPPSSAETVTHATEQTPAEPVAATSTTTDGTVHGA